MACSPEHLRALGIKPDMYAVIIASPELGNTILAHKNTFNAWVAGQGAVRFSDKDECVHLIDQLFNDRPWRMNFVRVRGNSSKISPSHGAWLRMKMC